MVGFFDLTEELDHAVVALTHGALRDGGDICQGRLQLHEGIEDIAVSLAYAVVVDDFDDEGLVIGVEIGVVVEVAVLQAFEVELG